MIQDISPMQKSKIKRHNHKAKFKSSLVILSGANDPLRLCKEIFHFVQDDNRRTKDDINFELLTLNF